VSIRNRIVGQQLIAADAQKQKASPAVARRALLPRWFWCFTLCAVSFRCGADVRHDETSGIRALCGRRARGGRAADYRGALTGGAGGLGAFAGGGAQARACGGSGYAKRVTHGVVPFPVYAPSAGFAAAGLWRPPRARRRTQTVMHDLSGRTQIKHVLYGSFGATSCRGPLHKTSVQPA
jgi:hypothetical protein